MHLIDEATATTSEPTRGAVGVNPDSFFRKDSSGGTKVSADFLNAVQKELAYVITQSGDTLDKADDTQIHQALLAYLKGTSTNIVNPFMNKAFFQDVKATTVDGGASVAGTWHVRDLQQQINRISGCSITSNRITLAPGKYEISGSSPAHETDKHQVALYNFTDSAFEIIGTSENAHATTDLQTRSFVKGEFTITSAKTFDLRHYIESSNSTGQGKASDSGQDEVYADIEIWKLD